MGESENFSFFIFLFFSFQIIESFITFTYARVLLRVGLTKLV
jgi:hypothetical protein